MLISLDTKKRIELKQKAIQNLEKECKKYSVFSEKQKPNIFTYSLSGNHVTKDGPAMVAIAQYGTIYAMLSPDYLTKEQMVVFEFILRDIKAKDTIIVFSEKDHKTVEKYRYKKTVNVILYKD